MFGFVKQSTHDEVVAERNALEKALDRETSRLAEEREARRQLQAKVDRMTGGLKQNRPKIAA